MRKLFTLMVLSLVASMGMAQYYYIPSSVPGNPGGLNTDGEYPSGGGLDASWSVLLGPSNATPTWSNTATLPFSFDFNGNAVTQYKVSSSGVLTFTTGATAVPSYVNTGLPSANIPDNSIMVWGIEGTGANDNIVTKTFGTAPNRQHWVFFSSYTATSWVYWSIVMEETTNKIYIVDQRASASAVLAVTAGIQINGSTAYSVAGSPNLASQAGTDPFDGDNYYYEFIQGTQPQYDLSVISDDLPDIVVQNSAPFSVGGSLENLGTATVSSYDINYTVDGGAAVSSTVNTTLAPFGTDNFTVATPWTPTATGMYTFQIWADNINVNNADEVPANDTLTFMVEVVDTFVSRKVLFETYTSSTCGPCTPANVTLENLFNDPINDDKVVSIKYQMDWPGNGDPYYNTENDIRRSYYSINSIPRVEIDGGFDGNGNNVVQQDLDDAYAVPAFMSIDAEYEVVGQTVNIDVEAMPLLDFNSSTLNMYVAIFEYYTDNNVASNGETEFFHVIKKMVPDASGTVVGPLTKNVMYTSSMSYTFQGNYRLPANALNPINPISEHSVEEFTDLGVAVFFQDLATGEVVQANYAEDVTVVALDDVNIAQDLKVWPNPVQDLARIGFTMDNASDVSIQVIDLMGKVAMAENFGQMSAGEQRFEIQTQSLEAGVYFVQVRTGETVQTQKITVVR